MKPHTSPLPPPDPEHAFVLDTERVAIFDLDGTLVDSVDGMTAAINRMLRSLKAAPLDRQEATPLLGHGLERFARRACQLRGVLPTDEDIERFLHDYRLDPLNGTRLYRGVNPVLGLLAQTGWRLAVCTNKAEAAALTILDGLGVLGYFDVVCAGDTVAWPKPDPRHIGQTLQLGGLLGLPAVMIGDNAVDIAAAAAYGIPCIFASWGYGQATGDASACHPAGVFTELPGLLERLVPASHRQPLR